MRGGAATGAWAVVVALGVGCVERSPSYDVQPAVAVVGVEVTPGSASLCAGLTQRFGASLRLSDGRQRLPTYHEVTWSSSEPSVATVDPEGLATTGRGNGGVTTIAATVGTATGPVEGHAVLTRSGCRALEALEVRPADATLAPGQQQQYTALGRWNDGSAADATAQVQWSSSMPAVATVDPAGLARAVAPGVTEVVATLGAVSSNTATLTVVAPRLVSIALAPLTATLAAGSAEVAHIVATAHYADASERDVTAQAEWFSSAPAVVAVSNAVGSRGQVRAASTTLGTAYVTAAYGGIDSPQAVVTVGENTTLRAVAVSPSPVAIGGGETLPLVATMTYGDGRTADGTRMARWTSSAPSAVTVDASTGVVRGVGPGAATITATILGLSGTAMVTCTCEGLVGIEVVPATVTLTSGARLIFAANGIYPDGSTRPLTTGVTWSSTAPDVASVDATGTATALVPGTTRIRAAVGPVGGTGTLYVFAP